MAMGHMYSSQAMPRGSRSPVGCHRVPQLPRHAGMPTAAMKIIMAQAMRWASYSPMAMAFFQRLASFSYGFHVHKIKYLELESLFFQLGLLDVCFGFT